MERRLIGSQCIALLGIAATGINMTAKNVVARMMAFADSTQTWRRTNGSIYGVNLNKATFFV
jgi:hypothetical protein